jgi:hypothetical protein
MAAKLAWYDHTGLGLRRRPDPGLPPQLERVDAAGPVGVEGPAQPDAGGTRGPARGARRSRSSSVDLTIPRHLPLANGNFAGRRSEVDDLSRTACDVTRGGLDRDAH